MNESSLPHCVEHPQAAAHLNSGFGDMVCNVCQSLVYWTEPTDPIVTRLSGKEECYHCGERAPVKLRKNIASSGKALYFWYCTTCERYAQKQSMWIPHTAVQKLVDYFALRYPNMDCPKSLDDIECLNDGRGQNACFICGAPSTEYNHFMPQVYRHDAEIAPDWPRWAELGAYLCPEHHLVWHGRVASLNALATARNGAHT